MNCETYFLKASSHCFRSSGLGDELAARGAPQDDAPGEGHGAACAETAQEAQAATSRLNSLPKEKKDIGDIGVI